MAADHVDGVPLNAPLSKVARALKNSASATSAETLEEEWRRDKTRWVRAARNFGSDIQAYAADLDMTDVDAAGQVEKVAHRAQGIVRGDWKAD